MRSVADGFSQFSSLLFTTNHNIYRELQTFSIQVEVSKPNQKQMLYANSLPKKSGDNLWEFDFSESQ